MIGFAHMDAITRHLGEVRQEIAEHEASIRTLRKLETALIELLPATPVKVETTEDKAVNAGAEKPDATTTVASKPKTPPLTKELIAKLNAANESGKRRAEGGR